MGDARPAADNECMADWKFGESKLWSAIRRNFSAGSPGGADSKSNAATISIWPSPTGSAAATHVPAKIAHHRSEPRIEHDRLARDTGADVRRTTISESVGPPACLSGTRGV
jgi:hypothetical protein